jgi:hypothetical protein
MQIKWLLWVRRTHLYLGVFFAPLLLLFTITGWWQTVTRDRNKGAAAGAPFIQKLSDIHIEQYYPIAGSHHFSTWMFKTLVVAMCIGIIVLVLLGIVMAFIFIKKKVPVLVALALGILVPITLLLLAHWQ